MSWLYSRKKLFLILAAADILILVGLLYYFCGGTDLSAGQKQSCHKIGMSYMTMNNEFYKILNEQVASRVESEGDMYMLFDPALDAGKQQKQIDLMLERGIDVLIVTPVDWKSLSPALERAKEKGVRVIAVDSDVYDNDLVDCTIKSDNYSAGVQVGEYVLKENKEKRFVLLTHNMAKSGLDRIQGFKDTVMASDNIEIVSELDCKGQLELAEPALNDFIKEGKAFDGIFALNDLAAVGAVAALEENGLSDGVEVFGVDGSPDAKGLINEGFMKGTAAQFPTKIGKKTGDVIYELLSGKSVSKEILVPVEFIAKENIEKYGVERWQ